MNRLGAILASSVLALCAMAASAQSSPAEKWYEISQIGLHVVNGGVTLQPLSPELARRYFAGNFLLNWPMPADAERRRVRALEELRHQEPQLMSGGDPRPFAAVTGFSRTRINVSVTLILGGFRWHHYVYELARYEMARDPAIDAAFNLPVLERKMTATYRGIAYGTPAAQLLAQLGPPDHEYPAQSLSLRNLYYVKDDLQVELHDGLVYTLEHGKPGWLMAMPPPGVGPAHGPAPTQ